MKTYIGPHEVLDDADYLELALGTPLALWLGEGGESEEERAARLDAARDILADDLEVFDRVFRYAMRVPGTVASLAVFVPTARRSQAHRGVTTGEAA